MQKSAHLGALTATMALMSMTHTEIAQSTPEIPIKNPPLMELPILHVPFSERTRPSKHHSMKKDDWRHNKKRRKLAKNSRRANRR